MQADSAPDSPPADLAARIEAAICLACDTSARECWGDMWTIIRSDKSREHRLLWLGERIARWRKERAQIVSDGLSRTPYSAENLIVMRTMAAKTDADLWGHTERQFRTAKESTL